MRAALLFALLFVACGRPVEIACYGDSSITCEAECVSGCWADDAGVVATRWTAECEAICWDNRLPRRDGGAP